ncbi:MAG: hypothetical protein MJZ34_02470 [Paludibacteraceae bacterium]|nr:hypothetical protein [Paludibacteraceae bacterium]
MINWGIIDGNFFLRRNFSAAKNAKTLLEDGHIGLVKSFLSTIFKYRTDLGFENVIIAWDKLPYKKLADITEYKQDRHYATEEDVARLDELIKEASGKNLEELEKQREALIYDIQCEKIFHHAKNSLLSNLSDSKIINLRLTGYEADDIAYLTSRHLSSKGESCILVSVDSDWLTFLQPNVSFFKETLHRSRRKGQLYTFDTAPDKESSEEIGCSLYEVGNLKEVYTGGHNNVSGYKHKSVSFVDFAKGMLTENVELPEFEYFNKRVKALNINNYDNTDMINLLESRLTDKNSDQHAKDYLKYLGPSFVNKYESLGGPKVVGGFLL